MLQKNKKDCGYNFLLFPFILRKVVNNTCWERCTNKTNIQNPSFWKWRQGQHLLFKAQAWSNSGMAYYTTTLPNVNANIFTTVYNIHSWGLSFEGNQCVSSSTQALACSRRSDTGEWCEVKKEMKSRGETLPLALPCFYFFMLLFTSHCSPLSECLEQATQALPYLFFVCACLWGQYWYSLKGKNLLRGGKFWTAAQPVPRNPEMPSTEQG